MQPIQGLHHITAFASNPQDNVDFYTQVLGQRLVKTTVNFDDPGTYHLYYGDEVGNPGTIMTFFPWPQARRGAIGNGEVTAVAYSILPESLDFWQARLAQLNVPISEPETRFGETVLPFFDPDGMRLELITHQGVPAPQHWENGPIPAEHALRGFHGVTMWVWEREASEQVLTRHFGYQVDGEDSNRLRFKAQADGVAPFVEFVIRPDGRRGQMGAGSVHHVAFRTRDDAEQVQWQTELAQAGYAITDVRDRQYFHSIYFREPSSVLFEIATDAPGFPYDEAVAELGKHLKLPTWLEPHREMISQKLPKFTVPEYRA